MHPSPAVIIDESRVAVRSALTLLVGRVLLVAAASVLTWLALAAFSAPVAFPPAPLLAALAMLPVNIVCLLWVRRLLRARGKTLNDLIGFSRRRLGTDILWGLLWVVVLYLPFVGVIMGVMWALHGPDLFTAFETVFFDPAAVPALPMAAMAIIAVLTVVTFAPLNAPVEELVYRGYAQQGLAQRMPVAVAIVVSAALFGVQHAFYAPTPDAVLVYVCAFFMWGIGSGIIAHRQGRLMPIIIAHGLVNLATTAPVLAFMALAG